MLHQFASTAGHPVVSPARSAGGSPKRVNRSCVECTRRKIKCDGGQPCSSCEYYKVPHACGYRRRTQRKAVSRSTLDKVSEQTQAQAHVLGQLYPGISLAELADKSRSELLALLSAAPSEPEPEPLAFGSGELGPREGPARAAANDSGETSEDGEQANDRQWDEAACEPATIGASDDINAISLATDRHRRSYLGAASMSAALRALFRLCPGAKEHVSQRAQSWPGAAPPGSQPQQLFPLTADGQPGLSLMREQRCIDFYFEHIHSITPVLDEAQFREAYASDGPRRPSRKGLLNMVFALGSIASGSDTLHEQYYAQARSYITLESLGSGNLESLQALCLLGGYYLHYRNSPNMAYAILGAAHRVAIALGLHRESRRPHRSPDDQDDHHDHNGDEAEAHRTRAETRRRAWWSLFCLDTWASMTLGRPTCGRWEPDVMDTPLPGEGESEEGRDVASASLRASAQFCLICDRIQRRFAQFGRLAAHEALAFDAELQAWYSALPADLATGPSPSFPSASSASSLTTARDFMRNRYYNVRLILGRALLVYRAHDRRARQAEPSTDEQAVEGLTATVAAQAIESIARHWTPNRVHVWNAAWYLFQACTVPLLLLAVSGGGGGSKSERGGLTAGGTADGDGENRRQAASTLGAAGAHDAQRASLATALATFADMRPWMRAVDRAPDIVAALYDAVLSREDASMSTPSGTDGGLDLWGWCDDQIAELDWSVFMRGEDTVQGMYALH